MPKLSSSSSKHWHRTHPMAALALKLHGAKHSAETTRLDFLDFMTI